MQKKRIVLLHFPNNVATHSHSHIISHFYLAIRIRRIGWSSREHLKSHLGARALLWSSVPASRDGQVFCRIYIKKPLTKKTRTNTIALCSRPAIETDSYAVERKLTSSRAVSRRRTSNVYHYINPVARLCVWSSRLRWYSSHLIIQMEHIKSGPNHLGAARGATLALWLWPRRAYTIYICTKDWDQSGETQYIDRYRPAIARHKWL